jgi:predicted transcriptional regulator
MPRFGELEAAIMDVVWSAAKAITVREIRDRLDREPSPAYNTVLTVTEILYRKGWLAREKNGKAFRYWPAASRDDYTAQLMDEALDSARDRTAALVHFMESMRPEEMAELRRALDTAKDTAKDTARDTAGNTAGNTARGIAKDPARDTARDRAIGTARDTAIDTARRRG